MRFIDQALFMRNRWIGGKIYNNERKGFYNMAVAELLAPVPAAADYSVSADLWQRLEDEIKAVSERIEAGEDLVPEDVANVRKLKTQVDNYVTSFNRAMQGAQSEYRKLVERRLTELGYETIEQFVTKKKQEQTALQNNRISIKMDNLKMISDGLLERTVRLKEIPVSKELLPAFTARFPKVQSGAKSNDIKDWRPYFAIMSRTITVMDTFFQDPKYADASLLPLHSGTIRELLMFAKDGKEEHLAKVPLKFEEDKPLIHDAKLKQQLVTKEAGIEHIRKILEDMEIKDGMDDAAREKETKRAWEEISRIVRLVNN